jgi:hypothetical protein
MSSWIILLNPSKARSKQLEQQLPRRLRVHPLGDERCMQLVDLLNSEDQTPPPGSGICWRQNEVQEGVAQTETRKAGLCAPVEHVQTDGPIERYRSGHIPYRQRHGADMLDIHSCPSS